MDFTGDFFWGRREGTSECGVKRAPSGSRIFLTLGPALTSRSATYNRCGLPLAKLKDLTLRSASAQRVKREVGPPLKSFALVA